MVLHGGDHLLNLFFFVSHPFELKVGFPPDYFVLGTSSTCIPTSPGRLELGGG